MALLRHFIILAGAVTVMTGCSGGPSLTTGSLFGGSDGTEKKAVKAEQPKGDATTRAFQVGSVSARAVKCGYNFDPAKLKASFLAGEAAQGADEGIIARASRIYDIAYSGVTKGVSDQQSYCTEKRTAGIKKDLSRYLGGDFSERTVKVAKQDKGFFSGWGNSGSSSSSGVSVKPSTYEPF